VPGFWNLVGRLKSVEPLESIVPPDPIVVSLAHGLAVLAIVQNIDSNLALLLNNARDSGGKASGIRPLVAALGFGPLPVQLNKLSRSRQAADMRRQNPIRATPHGISSQQQS
jgi:hypothetical protein